MPFELFVNGTLMRGLKLHANMGDSVFLGEFRTAPYYRVHTINDVHPGMYRLNDGEPGGSRVGTGCGNERDRERTLQHLALRQRRGGDGQAGRRVGDAPGSIFR